MTVVGEIKLSDSQRAAVQSDASAIVVVAGAGSGKTEVAAQRLERILTDDPAATFRILAISFTVKAADELTERLQVRLGSLHERVDANTIHGFAHQLLRDHGTRLGLPIEPEVLTRDEDRVELFSCWLEDSGETVPVDLVAILRSVDLDRARLSPSVYTKAWNEALAQAGALDYEAMLNRSSELLEVASFRRQIARLYGHVLVDEAQNLTPSQYRLISTLIGLDPHLDRIPATLVGDDKQSIVGFNGADPKLISRFESDFSAVRFELAENFRSAKRIVTLADSVASSLGQTGDSSAVNYAAPGLIDVAHLPDESAEGEFLAHWVARMLRDGIPRKALAPEESSTVRPNEIAVLGRSAAALRDTKGALERRGVEVAIAIGPDEWLSTREAKTLQEMIALKAAEDHPSTHWQLARLLDSEPKDVDTSLNLAATLGAHRSSKLQLLEPFARADDPYQFMELLQGTAIDHNEEQWIQAWDVDRETITEAWQSFIESTSKSSQTWGNFRVFVSRVQRGAHLSEGVRLLTIHKAQGQEFRAVAVVGLNDGQLPDFRAKSPEEYRSELRTFYVAVSRPSRVLLLSRAESRLTRYGPRPTDPSPFLDFLAADA